MIRLALIGTELEEQQYAEAATRLGNVQVRPIGKGDYSRRGLKDVDAVVTEVRIDDGLVEICHRAGVRLIPGRASRFVPSLQTVKASLDSGKLGEPGLLRIHRWESRKPGKLESWAQLAREIDLALWLFGGLPTEIYATGQMDYEQLHLGFPNGASVLIDYSAGLPPGESYFSLSLIGSTGAAYVDDHHNMQMLYGGGNPSALKTQESQGVLAQLREITAAIEDDRHPPISIAEACAAVKVGEAASYGRAAHLVGEAYEFV